MFVCGRRAWTRTGRCPRPLTADEQQHLVGCSASSTRSARSTACGRCCTRTCRRVVETKDDVDRVLDTCDVDWCLDTGHLAIGGVDPVEFAEEAMERVGHVHLKDVRLDLVPRPAPRRHAHGRPSRPACSPPLGQGDVDIAGVVQTLERGRATRAGTSSSRTRRSPADCRPRARAPSPRCAPRCSTCTTSSLPSLEPGCMTRRLPVDVLASAASASTCTPRSRRVGFDGQQTFTKSVGGSPTNVAVAAARLGRRAGRRRPRWETTASATTCASRLTGLGRA